jgi:hypothetical protein
MAKMADLAAQADPTKEENAAEEAPVYRSSANIHASDMKTMGMPGVGQGDHVEGMVHGVVSATHEGGMMMHITHGALQKAKMSNAEKMYGNRHKEPDAKEPDNDADD